MASPTPRDELLPWLVRVALGAVIFELVMLRTATRVAIHIPGIDRAALPYRVAAESGRFAYYLAVVLVVIALAVVMRTAFLHGNHAVAAALAVFATAAFLARAGAIDDLLLAIAVVAAFGLAAVGCAAAVDRRLRPALLLFGGGFLLVGLYVITQQAAADGFRPVEASPWLLVAAETMVLAAPIVLVYSRSSVTSRFAIAWGAAVGGAALMALVVAPATTKIVLLWNLGLAGYLPTPVYAIAAGALTYALVAIVKSGDGLTAVGIGLLFVGGIGLHSTYQSALAILGLSVLVIASEVPERAIALVRPTMIAERWRATSLASEGTPSIP